MRNKQRYLIPALIWCLIIMLAGIVLPTACSSIPTRQHSRLTTPITSTPTAIIYSENLLWYERYWSRESKRRYTNAILILSHGHDFNGQWTCDYGTGRILVEDLVNLTRKQYPIRRIVLVICNPGGYTLTLPNVSYSLKNIWLMPDRDVHPRSTMRPNVSGNIYEMQENQ